MTDKRTNSHWWPAELLLFVGLVLVFGAVRHVFMGREISWHVMLLVGLAVVALLIVWRRQHGIPRTRVRWTESLVRWGKWFVGLAGAGLGIELVSVLLSPTRLSFEGHFTLQDVVDSFWLSALVATCIALWKHLFGRVPPEAAEPDG